MGSTRDWRLAKLEETVLRAASAIGGDEAAKWWYDVPIPDLDGLSPRQLVMQDRAADVFDYLATLDAYVPAHSPGWNEATETNVATPSAGPRLNDQPPRIVRG